MPNTSAPGRRRARQAQHGSNQDGAFSGAHAPPSPDLVRLSDVTQQDVKWLWKDRVPFSKLSLWVGDPGVGKSFVTLDVAARLSSGTPFPDQSFLPQQIGDTVLLSAEDDAADTILPRLKALGANCERIRVLRGIREWNDGAEVRRPFDLCRDIPRLREAINANTRLVVIDPISAYMGGSDTHKDSEVRAVLAELAALAAETGVAIICVTHLRKGDGAAMYRAMGSLAFVAAARSVWAFTKCKDDPDTRYMLPVKNNLAADDGHMGLSFTIESTGAHGAPAVRWVEGPVNMTAEEALAVEPAQRGRRPECRRDAAEWLQTILAKGPRASAELKVESQALNIAWRTVERAKKELGIEPFRYVSTGPWYWQLPTHADALPSFGESSDAA
jgi:putative DNA primase/helicase